MLFVDFARSDAEGQSRMWCSPTKKRLWQDVPLLQMTQVVLAVDFLRTSLHVEFPTVSSLSMAEQKMRTSNTAVADGFRMMDARLAGNSKKQSANNWREWLPGYIQMEWTWAGVSRSREEKIGPELF